MASISPVDGQANALLVSAHTWHNRPPKWRRAVAAKHQPLGAKVLDGKIDVMV
jgi:hypothetical protein